MLLAAVLASGCASKKFRAPLMGRSGEQQLAISRAIDATLDQFDLSCCKDRTASLIIRTMGQEEAESAAVTGYLSNVLREKIARCGGRFTSNPEECDMLLLMRIAVSGVDTTERDFTFSSIPVYVLFVVKGYVRGTMIGFDRKTGRFIPLRTAEAIDERGVAYLFSLYGAEIRISGKKEKTE
jgi:hypothetical protein